MSNTTLVQSDVPKLKEKQNYRTWNLRIWPLLKSRDELVVIEYTSCLKIFQSEKDKKNTTAAALAEAKRLRKAGITSPNQQ